MAEIFKNALAVIEKGFESLKTMKKDKREYKEYLERVKALPDDYEFVYDKITKYLWSYCGGGDGYDMLAMQAGLLELFEESAAAGKQVLEVTGEDVAAFSDELLSNVRTYTEDRRGRLNREVMNKLGKKDEPK